MNCTENLKNYINVGDTKLTLKIIGYDVILYLEHYLDTDHYGVYKVNLDSIKNANLSLEERDKLISNVIIYLGREGYIKIPPDIKEVKLKNDTLMMF